MEKHDNFRVHLHRAYPQVAKAAEILVAEFNCVQKNVADRKLTGSLEVEAFFGKLFFSDRQVPRFDNNLTFGVVKQIHGMLTSFTTWDCTSDWHIMYDYYPTHGERIRVSYQNNEQKVTSIRKHRMCKTDFRYASSSKADAKVDWELRNYLTRVNMKFEEEVPHDLAAMLKFQSVKISVRKTFAIASSNVPSISWMFEIIQFWTGPDLKSVETAMQTTPPAWTVECEILNILQTPLSEKEKLLVFAGLLIKMQDFIEFPTCYDIVGKNNYTSAAPGGTFYKV